jgi:hypothetical protein
MVEARMYPPFGAPALHSALAAWHVQNNPFWSTSFSTTKATVPGSPVCGRSLLDVMKFVAGRASQWPWTRV